MTEQIRHTRTNRLLPPQLVFQTDPRPGKLPSLRTSQAQAHAPEQERLRLRQDTNSPAVWFRWPEQERQASPQQELQPPRHTKREALEVRASVRRLAPAFRPELNALVWPQRQQRATQMEQPASAPLAPV